MEKEAKEEATKRLSYITGHVEAVGRMVEQGQYCVDIMKQLFAVRRALAKVEVVILDSHLKSCVVEGIRDGRQDRVLQELVDLYDLANR
ncbi:MAG: metal-sensing transcriptional repressor [Chloroflexi bacterium]|nr:metal-sensing transcriptional repressor [Chloroflexota bacterium]